MKDYKNVVIFDHPLIRHKIAILRDDENHIWIDGFGTDGKYLPDINSKNVLIIKKEG